MFLCLLENPTLHNSFQEMKLLLSSLLFLCPLRRLSSAFPNTFPHRRRHKQSFQFGHHPEGPGNVLSLKLKQNVYLIYLYNDPAVH